MFFQLGHFDSGSETLKSLRLKLGIFGLEGFLWFGFFNGFSAALEIFILYLLEDPWHISS